MSRLACGPAALAVALLVATACGAGVAPKASPIRLATYLNTEGRTAYFAGERLPGTGNPGEPAVRWTANAPGSISAQPLVTGGLVYWGSWDGYEHASTIAGAAVWSAALGRSTDDRCSPQSAGVAGTPTIAAVGGRSILYVAGGRANFFALDARTGSVIWNTALGSAPAEFIWGSAALFGNSLYVGVSAFGECTPSPGRLVQMDAASGSIRHVFEVVPRGCTGGGIWGSPAVDAAAGIVIVATGDADSADCSQPTPYAQAVVALRASDLSLADSWQIAQQDRVPDGDFGTTPTLFTARINGQQRALVGMANKNGTYYAFDRTRIGQGPVWHVVIARGGSCPYCGDGSIASSAFDGAHLYVGGGATTVGGASCAGGLRALDPSSGDAIWQECLTGGPVLAGVVSAPGLVLAGSGPDLVAAAPGSGQLQFKFTDPDPTVAFLAPVWIAGGLVYAGTSRGTLYALAYKTGRRPAPGAVTRTIWCPQCRLRSRLLVEVGVEDPHAGDAVDRQVIAFGGSTYRLGVRAVVDAEGLLLVVADIRVDPRHAHAGIPVHDTEAYSCALFGDRDRQPIWKGSFDHVSRHRAPPE